MGFSHSLAQWCVSAAAIRLDPKSPKNSASPICPVAEPQLAGHAEGVNIINAYAAYPASVDGQVFVAGHGGLQGIKTQIPVGKGWFCAGLHFGARRLAAPRADHPRLNSQKPKTDTSAKALEALKAQVRRRLDTTTARATPVSTKA